MIFFRVSKVGEPTAEEFERLTKEKKGAFVELDPLDGKEYGYMELGAWIGDQGLAMQYMALGAMLNLFNLISPVTVFQLDSNDPKAMKLVGAGFLAVIKKGDHAYLQVPGSEHSTHHPD